MKVALIFGSSEGIVKKRAIEHLSSVILEQTMEYPSSYIYPKMPKKGTCHRIFVGTKNDNPYIAMHSDAALSGTEEYSISVLDGDVAYDMIKQMRNSMDGDLYITALVEDGMFEENIMYPVALYSEMLWDTDGDLGELQSSVALRSYVEFA